MSQECKQKETSNRCENFNGSDTCFCGLSNECKTLEQHCTSSDNRTAIWQDLQATCTRKYWGYM